MDTSKEQRSMSGGGDQEQVTLKAGTQIKVNDLPVTLANDATVRGEQRHLDSIRNWEGQGKSQPSSSR